MTFLETTPAARDEDPATVAVLRSVRPAAETAAPVSRLERAEADVSRAIQRVATRVVDGTWEVLHVLGAHRWRDGFETDVERGWTQYRGSRCTICDEPWEGW